MTRRHSLSRALPALPAFIALLVLAASSSAAVGCAEIAPPASSHPVATPIAPAPSPQASAPEPASPERDAILARYVEARGGAARLGNIRSLRVTGAVKFDEGDFVVEATYGAVYMRPGSARVEFTIQGLTGVDAYDGTVAWTTEPWEGRRDPFLKSTDEAKGIAHDADIDGPLVDWRAKGNRVDYLGTEEIDGTRAHKLRVIRKDGDVEYRYLDPDAFLEIRVVTESHIRGAERISESDLGDYGQVAGVWMPFSIDSGRKGAPRTAHFAIDRIEANVEMDDTVFHFPAATTKVARTIAPGPGSASLGLAGAGPAGPVKTESAPPIADSGVLSGLGARNIGSAAMSGRVSAVAAFNENGKTTLYVAAASGGVWKSLDGGTTLRPVFDKNAVQSIGAIAVDPSHTSTVWVGTGESWTRNSVSIGDGIYRSADAGETWTNMGLPSSERIARILIHPTNGDVVYACVPGKLWSDSADRGLYKTVDGGKSWLLVLKGENLSTGCSGVSMDPKNPEVLFAGLWDFRRKGWTFRSGGDGPGAPSGSGLYRTADGGKTWTALTAATHKGLPAGPWGRVEVAVAPSDPATVYALIESKDSALFGSSDGGVTWEQRDKSKNVVWRPFYFARLVVDPRRAERLFKPDYSLAVSQDGGKSFAETGGGAHGDWHDLWIDPVNTNHVIGGDDGGLWISWDGGNRWWKGDNLPISQFYHVSVDKRDPYQVYGGLQDNSSWVGDSSYPGGISNARWENLYNSDGFWALVDPTDPESVYCEGQGGYIARVDRRTHATRDIQPKAGYKEKLRFNWNTPIHLSSSQKGTLYIGAQFLFRSRDRGDSWERISPDLSTNDPDKRKQEESGGVTVDNSSAEMHTTIYSISESPRDPRLIWVGTDDGNLQLSRDAGKSWTNVASNVTGLPRASWVSWVEASRFDAGTAYAAFDRHTFGDMTPWVYRTTDFGKTWTRIVGPDQGVRGYAHVVKEDVVKRDLLFLGTELGLWISVDGGARWAAFKGGDFPSVAVRDLEVHPRDHDLVIATHGRGIWIVDDISPLRALTPDVLGRAASFLPGRAVQQRMPAQAGWSEGDAHFVGQNARPGAVITYYQRARHLFGPLKLEVLDESGKVIATPSATKRRGINRVTWTMQVKAPRVPRAAQAAFSATQGPRVVPGKYTLRLTDGPDVVETKLEVALDRRAPFGLAERKAQFEASMRLHALFGEMSGLTDRIDIAHRAAEARVEVLPEGDVLGKKLHAVAAKLEETKKKIVATKEGGAITGEERIREHADLLYGALISWEGRPGRYQVERIDVLRRELADVAKAFDVIVADDIRPLDGELRSRKLDPIPTAAATGEAATGAYAMAALRCARSRGLECEEAPQGIGVARERD
jgi:photosystem II stability/assembly factor-like uncharacterized protein